MTFLHLFSYIFSISGQKNCHNICVAFLENLFIEFTTYVVKRVTVTQGSVKMDKYYSMF